MNNYFFINLKNYAHIYLIRTFHVLLIFISYLPLANINLNAIKPNVLSVIIFYYSIFTKKEILSKEYLLVLVIIDYLLVGPVLGKFIFIIYLGAYYFLKKKKHLFLNKGFLSILAYYFLFSFSIEICYVLSAFDLSKNFYLKDFIFILFNNLAFYVIFHSISLAQELLLNKSRLKNF